MQLVSTYAPAIENPETGQKLVLAVFDTFVDGKSLVVGLTVGTLEGNSPEDAKVTPLGQAVLERAVQYLQFRHPDGSIVVAGVASLGKTKERVRQVLQQAPPNCALLLLCANDKIYDKAFDALNVDFEPMKSQPQ